MFAVFALPLMSRTLQAGEPGPKVAKDSLLVNAHTLKDRCLRRQSLDGFSSLP